MGLGCVVAVLALLTAGCGSSHAASPNASEAKNRIDRAFVLFLQGHHPGFSGPSRCPSKRAVVPEERIPCVGEIHKGKKYVQVWASPTFGATVEFHHVLTRSWTRRWSKYAPAAAPGLTSVNSTLRAYDWRWLLLGVDHFCREKHHASCSAGALDGAWPGYPLFFSFDCTVQGKVITCRNKLGDAVRWRPSA